MLEEYKKTIIFSSISVVILILIVVFCLVDISLGPIKISSISTILKQHTIITTAKNDLTTQQNLYKSAVSAQDTEKKNFDSEKAKYDAISDETVNIIKEATAIENYSIEYMWIRLGNYAKTNNLSIVLVEPGGSSSAGSSTTGTGTTTTPTSDTTGNAATGASTTANDTTNTGANAGTTGTDATGGAGAAGSGTASANKDPNTATGNNSAGSGSNSVLKIQVSGSYMNVSDFIFQVENDKELKFKLDNISMEYVSGTTIKATFDVKNIIIKK